MANFFEDVLGGITGGIADLFGGYDRNRQQAAAAQNQIDWQNVWRSNAHQTEVEDLRKAGLNPILSAGGAGAPMGATQQPQFENIAKGMAASAKEALMMKSQIEKLNQDANLSKEQQKNVKEDTRYKKALADVVSPVSDGVNAIKSGVGSTTETVLDTIQKSMEQSQNSALQSEEKRRVEEARKRFNEKAKAENARNKLFGNPQKHIELKNP